MDSNNQVIQTNRFEGQNGENKEDELLAWVEDFLSDEQKIDDQPSTTSGESEGCVERESGKGVIREDEEQGNGDFPEIDNKGGSLECDHDGTDEAEGFVTGEPDHRSENRTEVNEDGFHGGSMEEDLEDNGEMQSNASNFSEEISGNEHDGEGEPLPYTTTPVQSFIPDDDESESTGELGDLGVEAGSEETLQSDGLVIEEDNSNEMDVEANASDVERFAKSNGKCCLEVFHDMLYYLRMSPKKSDGSNPLGKANYVPLTLVRFTTLLGTLEILKNYLILGDRTDNVSLYYITIGYTFNVFLIRFCFAYLLATRFDEIIGIMKVVKEFGAGSSQKMIASVVCLPMAVSMALSISTRILKDRNNLEVDERQVEDFIVGRSYFFSKTLFLWDDGNYENDTNYLRETYGTSISATSVSLALSSYKIKFVGYLNENLTRDFGLVVAFTVFLISQRVWFNLKHAMANKSDENCNRLWTRYKQARKITAMINGCYWPFFYCLHLDNLMFCLYFLLDHVYYGENVPLAVMKLTVIAKIAASYYNSQFGGWIEEEFRGVYTPFMQGSERVTTSNLQAELDKNPISIGDKTFFIGGTLIFQLMSALGSTFIMLAAAEAQHLHQ